MPRADGPFEVLERISDNAYKVDLPGDYGVSATFNVADLSPYLEGDYLEDLRENSLSQGENDGGPSLSMINSSIKTKIKLKDIIFEALNSEQSRGSRTASSTACSGPCVILGVHPIHCPIFVLEIC